MGEVLGLEEEGGREALDSNVKDSVLRRFQLEVSDAFEDVAQVDDKLIVDRAYRPEFAIDQHLEPWITKRGQDGYETRVTVFWRCQLEMLRAHLTVVSNIS